MAMRRMAYLIRSLHSTHENIPLKRKPFGGFAWCAMAIDIELPKQDSVWGIAGNVVDERPYGPAGEDSRRGTRLFRPNAKVYLASLRHAWVFNHSAADHSDWGTEVLGQHRKSRDWIVSWVRFGYTTNWRVQRIYAPQVLERLYKLVHMASESHAQ